MSKDAQNKTMPSFVSTISDLFKSHYAAVSFACLVAGFIYVQGLYSPFLTRTFLFGEPMQIIVPVSYQTTIINGVLLVAKLVLIFFLAYTARFFTSTIRMLFKISFRVKIGEPFENRAINKARAKLRLFFTNGYFYWFLFMITTLGCVKIPFSYLAAHAGLFFWGYYFAAFFFIISFYAGARGEWERNAHRDDLVNDVYKRERKQSLHMLNNWASISFCLFLAVMVYMFGLLFQAQKANAYISAKDDTDRAYKIATLYSQGKTASYIYLDLSKDYFIGFNTETKRTEIVPAKSYERIELQDSVKTGSACKLSEQSTLTEDGKKMAATIGSYYDARFVHPDAVKYTSLLSKPYYRKLNFMSPDIMQNGWNRNPEYEGKKFADYYGYEMSEPKLDPESNMYRTFVIEYWKSGNEYMSYSFLNDNGAWKIMDAKKTTPFQLAMIPVESCMDG